MHTYNGLSNTMAYRLGSVVIMNDMGLLSCFRYAGGMQPPQRKSSQDLTAIGGGIVGSTGK